MNRFNFTLPQWESFIREQIGDGEILLGQLPIGDSPFELTDMNQLGQLLAELFSRYPFLEALKVIKKSYPLSFALYLVLQGVFNYRGGEYWTAPGIQLGISEEYFFSASCGKTFREILNKYGLPSFANIDGLTNLVPILAHGGIPNYSLGDFFKLLNRSLGNQKILLDAESLIEEWGINPEETFFFIDRPVQRFVLHGGAVAEDFVNRCVALFMAKTDEAIAEIDLPARVTSEFKNWRTNQNRLTLSQSRARLERPYVYIDPYADGVCIALPPQQFPVDIEFSYLAWEIKDNESVLTIETERQRIEDGYEFAVSELLPVSVAEQYHVTLKNEKGIIRSWVLAGTLDEPIVFFDPDTGDLIRKEAWRQPGEKWIVYPSEYELIISEGQKTGDLPQQYGPWGKFFIEEWVLHPGGSITLISPSGESQIYEIDHNMALRRPFLDGGTQPLIQSSRSSLPLYSGQPPLVVIPFGQAPDALQLSRWRITIEPDGKARPNQRTSFLLSDLQDWVIIEDKQVFLDLTSPKLFGPKPCGKFTIDIHGPLGRGRQFKIRLVPKLQVEGHQELYLSTSDGDAVIGFTCDSNAYIECGQNEGIALITKTDAEGCSYQATISENVSVGKFVYIDSDQIRIPFTVKVRRLRWGLWEQMSPTTFTWGNTVLRLFPQSLVNVHETDLFIDLPTLVNENSLYGGWRLLDSDDGVIISRSPDRQKKRHQLTIHLGEIMPACRTAQENGTILNLQIWIVEEEQEVHEWFVDAMYLLPTLELGQTETQWLFEKPNVSISIMWESQQASPYMKMLVWPLDQPWQQEPLIFDAPSNCEGFCEWTAPVTSIPSLKSYGGDFIGEMVIRDPWSTEKPKRPKHLQANTVIFRPKYARNYYAYIEERFCTQNASPEEALTLLAFYYRQQKYDRMHEVNSLLRNFARTGKLQIEQLILWADLVRETSNKQAYKLVQWTLFDGKFLEKMETDWIDDPQLSQYLLHLSENLPNPKAYTYLLNAGYLDVRRKCLTGLCHFGDPQGYDELLKDVATGEIILAEAAKMLALCVSSAAKYLLQKGSQDAFKLLQIIARLRDIEIQWLAPGYQLYTDIGHFEIQKIQLKENGHLTVIDNCSILDNCKITVLAQNEYETTTAVLSLPDKTIEFKQAPIYQCKDCGYVYSDHQKLARHHDIAHPKTSTTFRSIKSGQFVLKKTVIQLPKRDLIDEPTSN